MQPKKPSFLLSGVLFTLLGAVLFSTKAVLAKLIYRESSIGVVSLLTLRMLFALPFYIGMYVQALPGYRRLKEQQIIRGSNPGKGIILQCILVGILGYYVSSFLDFSGLKFISAGLERIILFIYPTFTVVFAALLYKARITPYQVAALVVSYAGVALAFAGDIHQGQSTDIFKGSLLVFGCAITYSLYVLISGRLIPKMGASYFTSIGMMSATAGVFIHFLVSQEDMEGLRHLSLEIYLYILLMSVFATVVPSLLLAMGLNRIGSSNVAIISSVGPMATILQAWWLLGESFGLLQAIGTLLVIGGVLIIGRKVKREKPLPVASIAE